MLHMLPSRAQDLRCRRECVDVSYRPAVAMAIDISSSHWFPSDVAVSEFKYPANRSAAPQGRWMMVSITIFIVASLSGAMYHLMTNHRLLPDAT